MSKRVWIGVVGSSAVVAMVLIALLIRARADGEPWVSGRSGIELSLDPSASIDSAERFPAPSAQESSAAAALSAPMSRSSVVPRGFDVTAAMSSIREIAAFGPRGAGSSAEARAAEYLRQRLQAIGLEARVEEFPLATGGTSRNVIARVGGYGGAPGSGAGFSSADVLVLGAHYDSKPPSPGANDNASGCAVLLELAAILHEDPLPFTVEFVFFGAEETIGSNPDHHHFGSRYRVSRMSEAERKATVGMLSIDMVGYGTQLHSRTMGRGPRTLSDALVAYAQASGVRLSYLRDPGKTGWSDHEPYELVGIPVAWLEWRDDPGYHTAGDTADRIQSGRVAAVGETVLGYLRQASR